jgi:hypothetical protein
MADNSGAGKLAVDTFGATQVIHVSKPGRTRISYDCGGEPCTCPVVARSVGGSTVLVVQYCPACGQKHELPFKP